MRVSGNWLREWVDHGLSVGELGDGLTMAGLEVDSIEVIDPSSGSGGDTVYELGLTPNRADCLGMAGVAREVGVIARRDVGGPGCEPVAAEVDDTIPVTIDAPAACPRYAGRIVRDIDPRAESPSWLRERLERSGIASLGPVVDITNYVMIELGQPMHAFDLDRIDGGITVRMAAAGERLKLLDGSPIEAEEGTLLIADGRGPLALAGIMGGEGSGVTTATRHIFLESAFFTPTAIAGRARGYGLHTDSSHRFERGVDPALQLRAIERATALIVAIAGGRPGPVVECRADDHQPGRPPIVLREGRISGLLGITIAAAEVAEILSRLGCRLDRLAGGWKVTPPSWRFDLAIEPDLVEEVGRIHGYDKIPASAGPLLPTIRPRPEAQVTLPRLRRLLVDRGYFEAITYSFVDLATEEVLAPGRGPLALANPISADLAVMRTTLWSGLIPALRHNLNRQHDRVRLFETGLAFIPGDDGELVQRPMVAGVAVGPAVPEQWGEDRRETDFFDLKGDVEAVLALAGIEGRISWRAASHPALHPGQSAALRLDGHPIGVVGALHPVAAERLDIDSNVYLFELDIEAITHGYVPKVRDISSYPSIRRDLALVVDEVVSVAAIEEAIGRAVPNGLMDQLVVFDLYSGPRLGEGRKSIALGLILQDLSCTLTGERADEIVASVVTALEQDVGASLRK